MITGTYTFIRGAEHDDVPALAALYGDGVLRAGLLDARREPIMPAADDLRELLGRKEILEGAFYAVEDLTGQVAGFCILRGMNPEARHCEGTVLFLDEACFDTPLADEVAAFMTERAFTRWGLQKLTAHCLRGEQKLAAFLVRNHFQSAGVQREVLYARGCWHDLETFALHAALTERKPQAPPSHAL